MINLRKAEVRGTSLKIAMSLSSSRPYNRNTVLAPLVGRKKLSVDSTIAWTFKTSEKGLAGVRFNML